MGNINHLYRKTLRTAQSQLPFLKDAKDRFYLYSRRLLKRPHDIDFRVLSAIPDSLSGCYVDVGANQGQSIESILLFKPNAQIVSFEPNPSLHRKLEHRYGGNPNVRVVNVGLADRVSQFELFVPVYNDFVYDGLASFKRESCTSDRSAGLNEDTIFGFNGRKLRFIEVACRAETLDMQMLDPLFVKIDVEGYEYHVLQGAQETLRRSEPVLLVEGLGNSSGMRLLEQLGYREYLFDGDNFSEGVTTRANSLLLTPRRLQSIMQKLSVDC